MAVVAAALGRPMMPWQRQVADVIGEYDPETGRPFYREWRLTVPRQSGKTMLTLPKLITTCLLYPGCRVVYTAQTRKDARKKFIQEQVPILLKNDVFGGMFTPFYSNGEERITWSNDSVHGIDAVTEKAGHGGTLHEWIGDEAFAIGWEVEQAMRPAMSTIAVAQLGIVSTAGKNKYSLNPQGRPMVDDETGEKVPSYLWAKVQDGRSRAEAGQRSGVAYFEWSASDEIDISDPSEWPKFMPAIGFTQSIDTIRADYDGFAGKLDEFERAYGNRWRGDSAHVQIIPAEDWQNATDLNARHAGRLVWAVAVSEDRSWAAIGACGTDENGRELVELIDYRCNGTSWIVPRLVELRARHGRDEDAVALDPASPAGSLIPDLEGAKDELGELPFTVKRVPLQGKAHAAGGFFDSVVDPDRGDQPPRLAHRGQAEVTTALESAVRRYVGEKAFVFEEGPGKLDICPLQVVVYAHWLHRIVPDDWYEIGDSIL